MQDREFRRSLGEFATGVAVVLTAGDEGPGGDHVIFVVRVVRHAAHPDTPMPLIFFRGRYRDLVDETEREPEWPLPIHY